MKSRSLFGAIAGALLLTAALIPQAHAQTVVVYFNFEDGTEGTFPDITSDDFPENPGGGSQTSVLSIIGSTDVVSVHPGLSINRTAGDNDVPPKTPDLALSFFHAKNNPGAMICFNANTAGLTDLALSFAVDNAGNGYNNVDLTINGTSTTGGAGLAISTSTSQLITFNSTNSTINNAANDGIVTFCLVFTGGQSNGVNRQTVIDNIQLTAVPEPATVGAGLLSVLALCWHQRRRLIRSARLRRV
jgi:hypothetical protein